MVMKNRAAEIQSLHLKQFEKQCSVERASILQSVVVRV